MAASGRQFVRANGEDAPVRRRHQQLVGRIGGDEVGELVAFLELQLRRILDLALGGADPATFRQDDGDRLARNEGLGRDEGGRVHRLGDRGPARRDQRLAHGLQLLGDRLPLLAFRRRQRLQVGKFFRQRIEFLLNRHLFQTRQLTQPGVENEVGLNLRQAEARDQDGLGLLLLTDDTDYLVQVEEDDAQTFQQVQALFDPLDPPLRTTVQHLAPVIQEGAQAVFQPHDARRAAGVQHVHVDREADLQIGQLEQAFHKHFRLDGAVLGLQNQADVLGRFVTHIAQQRRLLVLDQVRQRLDQSRLLHLIGHFGHNDTPHAAPQILGLPARAQAHPASARLISVQDGGMTFNRNAPGREVGAWHMLDQVLGRRVGTLQQ